MPRASTPAARNVNPGARQWRPDLIGYDAISAYGSPSYYAFQMFSQNLGDEILSLVGSETVRLGRETLQLPRKQSWLVASPILALALVPLFGNWNSATRRDDTTTRDTPRPLMRLAMPMPR